MSDPPTSVARPDLPRRLDRLLFAGGVGLFLYLLFEFGAEEVWQNLRLAGWGIVLVIAQEFGAYVANTAGWWAAFRSPRPPIPRLALLEARIIGDAVNYLTPTAGIGGEFVRAHHLRRYASMTALAASVSVAKLTQFAGQLLFLAIGLLLVLPAMELPETTRDALTLGTVMVLLLVVALLIVQRRGVFAPLLGAARRLGIVREHVGLGERLARLDAEIARYHIDGGFAALWSTLAFALGWAIGLVEMALLLWLLGIEVTVSRVVAIEVLSIAFDSLLFFVPAKAGTQEAGKVVIFTVLGLDPAKGLALGILRRIRELSWAGLGIWLWWRDRNGR